MKRVLFITIIALVGLTFSSQAGMKLKLQSDLSKEMTKSLGDHYLESNLKLELPAELSAPSGQDLYKGLWMIGFLLDYTIPFGNEDDGFKHIAGAGFSGHIFASYVLSKAFLIGIRAGYIKYGDKTQEGHEFGQDFKYVDKYNQIPILLTAYYLIATNSGFKPYIGLAFGLFLQTYCYEWEYSFEGSEPMRETGEESSSSFGIVPTIGFYYFVASAMMIQFAVEYNYLFSGLPVGDDSSDSDIEIPKASSLSILLGLSFALGGGK